MQRHLLWTAAVALLSAMALAAADIPARYVGSFPSVGSFTSITGTFTGKTLALRYVFVSGARFDPATANLSCVPVLPSQSRCTGRFMSDDGRFKGRLDVTVTWSAGKPVAMEIGKS